LGSARAVTIDKSLALADHSGSLNQVPHASNDAVIRQRRMPLTFNYPTSKESLLAGYASLPRALSFYSLSIALIAAAFFLHESLERLLGDQAAYLLFAVPAVIVAGGLGGLGPALLTTGLGIFVGMFFSGEDYSLTLGQFVSIGAFITLGAGMGVLGDRLKQARSAFAASAELLRLREAHLTSILDTIPDAMIVIDDRKLIRSFSSAAERLFGYSQTEVLAQNVNKLMPPADRENHDSQLRHYMATGERLIPRNGHPATGQRKDGSTFPMELFLGEMKTDDNRLFTGFVRDLTERHKSEARMQELQTELFHVSRLAALGEMASTLAHEVNQPLTVVTNYLKGARRLLENHPDERLADLREALNKAADQTLRAGEIVRHLREFVTRGTTERRVESIRGLIEEASALAFVGVEKKNVQLKVQLDSSVNFALVDKIQIQQVLLNLIRNAIEAMADSPLRELIVSSAPCEDNMVAISIADSGPGIAADVASRLFQAFFTTKPYGTGIGLSICRTIIESHGGKISVRARPEGGAIFCFTLHAAMRSEPDDGE
jgi:two-component system sensor kinase FixL